MVDISELAQLTIIMNDNNHIQRSSISKASTLEEIAEFWDNHSLDDYWDQTHEVQFEVRAERKRRVALDTQVYDKLEA